MQVKKRIFAGAVCEQVVYQVPDDEHSSLRLSERRPRFRNDEEREEHSRMISKRHHALTINANYTSAGYYVTLTFNNENEVFDFADARKIRDNYYRRIRRKFPESKVNIYMGRGKNTARIHFHMICEGIPEEVIRDQWIFGEVIDCKHLRSHNTGLDGTDCGGDLTALANYCFDHWTKEQGPGRRYKQSKTVVQPEEEKPVKSLRHYDAQHPPLCPEGYRYAGMTMCLPEFGYQRFLYIKLPEKRKRRREPMGDLVNA